MASRLKLQDELEEILGSTNVYFQPPASFRMAYPCIRYQLSGIKTDYADNKNYTDKNRYELVVIDRNPDTQIYKKIMNHFQHCRFDRFYPADNLNHYVLTLYY